MLLQKRALMVRDFVITGDHRNPYSFEAMNGLKVEPSGATCATDGHRLALYTPKGSPDGADYPVIDGFSADNELGKAFVLPADAAKMIEAAVPKKARTPVLGMVALDGTETDKNGHAVLAVTDLENPRTFRPAKVEGMFPEYGKVIPTEENTPHKVCLDLAYLESACKMLRRMGYTNAVLGLQEATAERKTDACPITMRATDGEGDCVVVIMPRTT